MITPICGDVFEVLSGLEPESFDAVVCDGPYFFEFMSREFDRQHKSYSSPRLEMFKALGIGGKITDDLRAMTWQADWLALALPLLRPGGRVVAASGSRVYHQLASGAALAGFSIDPMFQWINGSAMAQGLAIDKAIDKAAGAEREVVGQRTEHDITRPRGGGDERLHSSRGSRETRLIDITAPATPLAKLFAGYSTRLKDCLTPFLMAHRPVATTWAANAAEHGLAGLAVDAGRVPTEDGWDCTRPGTAPAPMRGIGVDRPWHHDPEAVEAASERLKAAREKTKNLGRYPANLALSEDAAAELDQQSGHLRSGSLSPGHRQGSSRAVPMQKIGADQRIEREYGGDEGGSSRFFHRFRYNPKTARAERMKGTEGFFWRIDRDHPLGFERISIDEFISMDHLPGCEKKGSRRTRPLGVFQDDDGLPLFAIFAQEITGEAEPGCAPGCQHRKRYQGNIHPTLKPIALIEYLARLVLPPDTGRPRRVLVPFAGTLSEAIGCALAGFDEVVAIEMEPTYLELGAARAAAWLGGAEEEQLELTAPPGPP